MWDEESLLQEDKSSTRPERAYPFQLYLLQSFIAGYPSCWRQLGCSRLSIMKMHAWIPLSHEFINKQKKDTLICLAWKLCKWVGLFFSSVDNKKRHLDTTFSVMLGLWKTRLLWMPLSLMHIYITLKLENCISITVNYFFQVISDFITRLNVIL